jgi:acetolactate decarboxylase
MSSTGKMMIWNIYMINTLIKLNGTVENREVEILGFYSYSHHAIFTHYTANMHVHAKTVDDKIAGHVDGLILGQEIILKLPQTK